MDSTNKGLKLLLPMFALLFLVNACKPATTNKSSLNKAVNSASSKDAGSSSLTMANDLAASMNSEVSLLLATSGGLDSNSKKELETVAKDNAVVVAAKGSTLLDQSQTILNCAKVNALEDCKMSVINSMNK